MDHGIWDKSSLRCHNQHEYLSAASPNRLAAALLNLQIPCQWNSLQADRAWNRLRSSSKENNHTFHAMFYDSAMRSADCTGFYSQEHFKGDLIYKLMRVKWSDSLISSSSSIVKRRRRVQYYPEIIVRLIGLVLCPYTNLFRYFPKHCTELQGGGYFMTGIVPTSSKETSSWSSYPLIDSRDS